MESLSQALVFGDYRLLSPDVVELFARTGLIHLLSASGFHMGVAYGLGIASSRLLPFRWRKPPYDTAWEFAISVFLMIILGVNAGWGKPIVRAFVLQLLWLGAKVFGLQPRLPWLFAFSLPVSLILGSGSFLSFFLSALSMFAILLVRTEPAWQKWWVYLLAPWLITMPFTAFFFHTSSVLAPLYNFIFAPLFGFFMVLPLILGLILKTFHFLWAASLINSFADYAGALLLKLLIGMEKIFGGGMSVGHGAFLLFLFFLPALFLKKRKILYLGVVTALYLLIPQNFSAAVLDVGQGDAILLRDSAGNVLVDTGRRDGKVLAGLANAGIAKIDNLFITHPDSDHIGGVLRVVARIPVTNAWISPTHLQFGKTFPYIADLELHQVKIHFWTSATPVPGLTCIAGPGGSANDTCPLCRFKLASGKTLLLTGDLSGNAEAWFLKEQANFLPAEFLKLAHHGSRYSSTPEFLDAVRPKTALVSAGKGNRYGHPHKEVIDRLEERKIAIRRTENGDIFLY